jgi:hypothetical protein
MSTVMYVYRVPAPRLWSLLDALRAYYVEHNMAFTVMTEIACRTQPDALMHARQWADHTELHATGQLFQAGDTWLLRILENGYFFLNHWPAFTGFVQPVFYDDRTDVPVNEAANASIAEWLDEQIAKRHYLLAPLIDTDTLMRHYWDTPHGDAV